MPWTRTVFLSDSKDAQVLAGYALVCPARLCGDFALIRYDKAPLRGLLVAGGQGRNRTDFNETDPLSVTDAHHG